jgi:CheY-like chemotaxis protein
MGKAKARARILIVEDNALIAFHLRSILTGLGFDVVGMVPSGEKALQNVEAWTEPGQSEMSPDLVLMDINLAGEMNGIETAAQIQVQFDIPVVYLTGYAEDVLLQETQGSGSYAYLSKPVRERKLYNTIEMMLDRYELEIERAL